ncbi:MAG: hypothetical protein AMXMBFR4_28230 [Candidatus Hydrogenedentota bacterium]
MSKPTPCSPTELKAKLDRGDHFLLLDVRAPEELDKAYVRGCVNIDLDELQDRLEELADWRDKEIVVLCHHGVRSQMAQSFLRHMGFQNVRNLTGGIDAYAREADPAVNRY